MFILAPCTINCRIFIEIDSVIKYLVRHIAFIMKVLAVCIIAAMAIVAQAKLSEEERAQVKKFYEGCVQSTGVSNDLITKARQGDFPESDKVCEYYKCMMEKMKFQNEDGSFNKEAMVNKLPERITKVDGEKIINQCAKVEAGATPCAAAYDCFKCFIKAVGNDFRFF